MTTPAPSALVQIRELTFTYPGGHGEVLRISALDITGRGLIAITGPSGAGKSTLIELMAGTLREPYGGSLKVLGKEWRTLTSDAERQRHLRRIGFIPQDYGLLTNRTPRQTLEQDLADAEVPATQRAVRIATALSQVAIDDYADRPIGQLSGGQRQRVAIARMLARNVDLVIADEPTANLDRELTWQTLGVLRQLAQNVPVLVITHEPDVAEACDRTIVLQSLAAPSRVPEAARSPERPRRAIWLALAAAIVAAAAGGAWWVMSEHSGATRRPIAVGPSTASHKAPDTRPSTAPSTTPRTTGISPSSPPAAQVTSNQLVAAGACARPCTVTGQVPFDDPVDGPSTLVTILDSSKDAYGEVPGRAYIVSVSNGTVTWKYQLPGSSWWQLQPTPRPTDKTGHIFLNYNPGRYNGVIVLDPTGNGFDDYGSLPPGEDPRGWRFYSSVVVDPTHSGVYEIKSTVNSCVPNCASGSEVQTYWHWNGTDYVQRSGS